MRFLSTSEFRLPSWSATEVSGWTRVLHSVQTMRKAAGRGRGFEEILAKLKEMARTGRDSDVPIIVQRRLGARAFTQSLLEDEACRRRWLRSSYLETLVRAQAPRLGRLSLLNLLALYFREFDQLEADPDSGILSELEALLRSQLKQLPPVGSAQSQKDLLQVLKTDGHWILSRRGPMELVQRSRNEGVELEETLKSVELADLDIGRYGHICRATYYLEVLKELAPNSWDPVLDELLKPEVAKAPYEAGMLIGHKALEIMIDRADEAPGERWEEFILAVAGDPRVASRTESYRRWWQPLGEERIEKVRSWMSKEDLRLFLQALAQYGKESKNEELQRMFPAREVFLKGLHSQGLIRRTRLLLGAKTRQSVKRILGKDIRTQFAKLDVAMSDKAVIYLDCGDFCLVEGSHSFRIWTYLAPPSSRLTSYEISTFDHGDLTKKVPDDYSRNYEGWPHLAVVHNGQWQGRVFEFLAENGVALEMEQMMTKSDHRAMLQTQGIPVVTPAARKIAEERRAYRASHVPPAAVSQVPTSADRGDRIGVGRPANSLGAIQHGTPQQLRPSLGQRIERGSTSEQVQSLPAFELKVLKYLQRRPASKAKDAAQALSISTTEVNRALYGRLKNFVNADRNSRWRLNDEASQALQQDANRRL